MVHKLHRKLYFLNEAPLTQDSENVPEKKVLAYKFYTDILQNYANQIFSPIYYLQISKGFLRKYLSSRGSTRVLHSVINGTNERELNVEELTNECAMLREPPRAVQ